MEHYSIIVIDSDKLDNSAEFTINVNGKPLDESAIVAMTIDKNDYKQASTESLANVVSVAVETLEERKRT